MYRLIKANVERVVDSEAAKDKLIAEGYVFLKEKKAAKTKTSSEKTGEPKTSGEKDGEPKTGGEKDGEPANT